MILVGLALLAALPSSALAGNLDIGFAEGEVDSYTRFLLFTPNDQHLITIGYDAVIRVHEVKTGKRVKTLWLPRDMVSTYIAGKADIAPDGRRLAVPCGRYFLVIDLAAERVAAVGRGHTDGITVLAFSPDGKRIATAGHDRLLKLWDPDTGACRTTMKGPGTREFDALAWSPDRRTIATAELDGPLRLWDVDTGRHRDLTEKAVYGLSLLWRPDGKQLAVLVHPMYWGVVDLSGKWVCREKDGSRWTRIAAGWSGDGRLVLTDRKRNVVDAVSGKRVVPRPAHPRMGEAGTLSASGRLLAFWGESGAIEVRTLEGQVRLRVPPPRRESARRVGWSADGRSLLWTASRTGPFSGPAVPTERAFDLARLKLGVPHPRTFRTRARLEDRERKLKAVCESHFELTRNGKDLIIAPSSQADALQVHGATLLAGERLALLSDWGLALHDTRTGQELFYWWPAHDSNELAPRPDGRFFVTGGKSMGVYSLTSRDRLLSLHVLGDRWVAWAADGHYAADWEGDLPVGQFVDEGPEKLARFVPLNRLPGRHRPDVIRRLVSTGSLAKAVRDAPPPVADRSDRSAGVCSLRSSPAPLGPGSPTTGGESHRLAPPVAHAPGSPGVEKRARGSRVPSPPTPSVRLGSSLWRLRSQPEGLVVSPDGKALAVSTDELTVEVFSTPAGQRRSTLGIPLSAPGHSRSAAAAFSPDGKKVATSLSVQEKWMSIISIRASVSLREERQFEYRKPEKDRPRPPPEAEMASSSLGSMEEYVSALSFSPDSKVLAAAIRLTFRWTWWDAGKPPRILQREENTIRLWEVSSGKPLRELKGHRKEIKGLVFSADGKILTSADEEGTLCFHDPHTGREKRPVVKLGRPLFCVAGSADGKLLAAGSRETVLVLDAATGKLRHRLGMPAEGARAVAFSRDDKSLAGAGGNLIRLWRLAGGAEPRDATVDHPVTAVAFSADGARLYSGHRSEQVVRCWNGVTLASAVPLAGHAAPVRALAFSGDGEQVISTTLERDFRSWDIRSGKAHPGSKEAKQRLEAHALASAGRNWLSFCDNGIDVGPGLIPMVPLRPDHVPSREPRVVFSSSADGKRGLSLKKRAKGKLALVVSNRSDNKVLATMPWTESETVLASLSPDGRTVVGTARDVVCFFDVASRKERRHAFPEQGVNFFPSFVKFAPAGDRVVVVGDPGVVRVVSIDGRLLANISETVWDRIGGLADLAISPDGRTVAIGQYLGSITVREVATGQLVRYHRADSFLFSPDNRLAALFDRGTLRVHDIHSGELLWQYRDPNGFVGNFAFSADGRFLAAACRDTTVLVWDLTKGKAAKPPVLDAQRLEHLWKDLQTPAADKAVEEWRKKPGSLWEDLAKGKSARAYEAMGELVANPERSMPFLKQRLLVPRLDAERLRRLAADLDSDSFATREAASVALAKRGRAAAFALRAALSGKPSLEQRRRARALLRDIEQEEDKLTLMHTRAIQVLEASGTKEAGAILKSLTEGGEGLHAAREARDALQRIAAKPAAGEHLHSRSAEPEKQKVKALAAIRRLGGRVLTEGTRRGKAVFDIDLSDTQVTDEDLRLLAVLPTLRSLNLFNTKITGPGLVHLKLLVALEEIDLSWPLMGYSDAVGDSYKRKPIDEQSLKHLQALPALRAINLSYTAVGEQGLQHLAGVASLRELDLSHCKVTDGMVRRLGGLKGLTHLTLRASGVADKGLEPLARLEHLQELNLNNTYVGDEGLRFLDRLRKLEDLALHRTRVTDVGLRHFEGLTKLRVLDLSETTVKGAGMSHLRRLTNLRRLVISHTPFTDVGMGSLGELTQLEQLDLRWTKVTAAGLGRIKALKGLRELNLDGIATDEGLRQVAALSRLRELWVNRSAVTDKGLAHLKGLARLSRLDVAVTRATDAGLAQLAGLPSLAILTIGDGDLTDAGLKHLKNLPRLRKLRLAQKSKFTARGIEELKRALPGLQVEQDVVIFGGE
jgi:WD40 repeat protein